MWDVNFFLLSTRFDVEYLQYLIFGVSSQNTRPNKNCPTIKNLEWSKGETLRGNTPWEMIKATSSSCLCGNYEGLNALCRGVNDTCSTIDTIINEITSKTGINADSLHFNIALLEQTKDIISKPSTYDAILACLKPCLVSQNIKNANYKCIHGRSCNKCGF